MQAFERHAVYVMPRGALMRLGSEWLGWDAAVGAPVAPPRLAGLPLPVDELTAAPRAYGFHGTIKPPFRLAEGTGTEGLARALDAFCAARAPVVLGGLAVRRLGRFVAIVPDEPAPALDGLAAAAVEELDRFRAPAAPEELARRRAAGLTARQEALLTRWGYPFVMEEFRFHLTLSGPLPPNQADHLAARLGTHFGPVLPRPYVIDSLVLAGQAADGRFRLISRHALTPPSG